MMGVGGKYPGSYLYLAYRKKSSLFATLRDCKDTINTAFIPVYGK